MDDLSTNFDDKPYLLDLYRKMETRMEKDRRTVISWGEPKEKGVSVKVGGVYAYVPFNLMPWSYRIVQWWNHVLPHMTHIKWFGRVIDVDYSAPMIKMDARQTNELLPHFTEGEGYNGVVVRTQKYAVTIDFGLHFHWKTGPVLHEIQNIDLIQIGSRLLPGQVLCPKFLGLDADENRVFSMRHSNMEERVEEQRELREDEVPIRLVRDESGRRMYLVKDEIAVALIAEKALYKEFKEKVKRAINRLQEGDVIKGRLYQTPNGKLRGIWTEWVPREKPIPDPAIEMAYTIGKRIENYDDLIRLDSLKNSESD